MTKGNDTDAIKVTQNKALYNKVLLGEWVEWAYEYNQTGNMKNLSNLINNNNYTYSQLCYAI